MFFDFETSQDSGEQKVNFAVLQSGDEWIFQGSETLTDFCRFILTSAHKGYTLGIVGRTESIIWWKDGTLRKIEEPPPIPQIYFHD